MVSTTVVYLFAYFLQFNDFLAVLNELLWFKKKKMKNLNNMIPYTFH